MLMTYIGWQIDRAAETSLRETVSARGHDLRPCCDSVFRNFSQAALCQAVAAQAGLASAKLNLDRSMNEVLCSRLPTACAKGGLKLEHVLKAVEPFCDTVSIGISFDGKRDRVSIAAADAHADWDASVNAFAEN